MIETTKLAYVDGSWSPGPTSRSYEGRTLLVFQAWDRRNHSDTLDYSDWRQTLCTYALVYEGRVAPAGSWDGRNYCARKEPEPLPIERRFTEVDCTNLFAWRGSDIVKATEDADPSADPEMAEDLQVWMGAQALIAMVNWARRARAAAAERARRAQEELDRPTVGKKMVVAGGRKVAKGTQGTVAYVRDGRALLKDDARWQDRAAGGVWVDGRHLKARVA